MEETTNTTPRRQIFLLIATAVIFFAAGALVALKITEADVTNLRKEVNETKQELEEIKNSRH